MKEGELPVVLGIFCHRMLENRASPIFFVGIEGHPWVGDIFFFDDSGANDTSEACTLMCLLPFATVPTVIGAYGCTKLASLESYSIALMSNCYPRMSDEN